MGTEYVVPAGCVSDIDVNGSVTEWDLNEVRPYQVCTDEALLYDADGDGDFDSDASESKSPSPSAS